MGAMWIEELELYRQFAKEVWHEDSGLAVWQDPKFQGVGLIANAMDEAEMEERDPR